MPARVIVFPCLRSRIHSVQGGRSGCLSLRESRPADRGIIVLGISHEGQPFLGAPGPEEKILIGDVITVYGREADIMPITK